MSSLPSVQPGPPPSLPERPEGAPDRLAGRPPWPPWTGLVAVLAALTVATVLGGVLLVPFGASDGDPPPEAIVAATFLQDLIFIAAALLMARLTRPPLAQDFGLGALRRLGRALALMVAVYLGFSLLSGIWITALGIDGEQSTLEQLGVDDSALNLLLGLVIVTVMAPVAEEVLFRGYMFTALRNWRGTWPAALITGAVFGAIHLGSSPVGFLVPLAIFGVGLCLLYAWTRSLYPCIALHAVNNSIAFSVAQEWTWQIPLTVAGATAVSLLAAVALARALGRGQGVSAAAPAPA
jgi:membrane protease YdiL (CAAX protease family)